MGNTKESFKVPKKEKGDNRNYHLNVAVLHFSQITFPSYAA